MEKRRGGRPGDCESGRGKVDKKLFVRVVRRDLGRQGRGEGHCSLDNAMLMASDSCYRGRERQDFECDWKFGWRSNAVSDQASGDLQAIKFCDTKSPTVDFIAMPVVNERRDSRNDRDRERYRDRDRDRKRRDDGDDRDHSYRRHSRDRNSPPPRDQRRPSPSPRQRSLSPYSKRKLIKPEPRSRSPSPWGQHQRDLAYDRAHPPPSASPPKEKQKPNYGLSGLLAAATNTKNGVVLKYHEPPEAKRCKGWRIFVYKNGEEVDNFGLDAQSSYLVGRDRNVTLPCPPRISFCFSYSGANGFRSLIYLWIILRAVNSMQ
jgi:hypothetical protein